MHFLFRITIICNRKVRIEQLFRSTIHTIERKIVLRPHKKHIFAETRESDEAHHHCEEHNVFE